MFLFFVSHLTTHNLQSEFCSFTVLENDVESTYDEAASFIAGAHSCRLAKKIFFLSYIVILHKC